MMIIIITIIIIIIGNDGLIRVDGSDTDYDLLIREHTDSIHH